MFLLSKPPVLRWVAATILVVIALWADLRPSATVEHPVAVAEIPAGDEVTVGQVRMIDVPAGLLEPVELPFVAGRRIGPGDPILATDMSVDEVAPPQGWLLVELAVPDGAKPGSPVVAIVSGMDPDPATRHDGVVVSVGVDDGFGGELAGCAFPADDAAIVAVAAADNRISVLIGG